MVLLIFAFALLSMNFSRICWAQAPTAPVSRTESVQDLVSHFTPEQKQRFDEALQSFNDQRYPDALALYKQLLTQLPGDPVLSKFASEAALNSGETGFATSVLKPLAATDPNDWQVAALLTRACAESGQTACRDSGMAHMLDLHRRGVTPPRMQQYILERVKAGDNTLMIRTSLEPWGPYKVYDLGQVLGQDGKIFLRITLESSDADQIQFRQEHPKEAVAGLRQFSLDAYQETGVNGNGQRTQTHFTYKFFVGLPPYETVREEFLKIANGKSSPLSSRTGIVVP